MSSECALSLFDPERYLSKAISSVAYWRWVCQDFTFMCYTSTETNSVSQYLEYIICGTPADASTLNCSLWDTGRWIYMYQWLVVGESGTRVSFVEALKGENHNYVANASVDMENYYLHSVYVYNFQQDIAIQVCVNYRLHQCRHYHNVIVWCSVTNRQQSAQNKVMASR
jgi:hypothetical protein